MQKDEQKSSIGAMQGLGTRAFHKSPFYGGGKEVKERGEKHIYEHWVMEIGTERVADSIFRLRKMERMVKGGGVGSTIFKKKTCVAI